MKQNGASKWRHAQEHRVGDVEEAIELAEEFRRQGTYDWFRGQVEPWPPHTSLMRLYEQRGPAQVEHVKAKLGRFKDFLRSHRELWEIAEDRNALFAVAQHYGIPTNYLDFTTEPAIAGFFACDTKQPKPGSDSCIYCLNTDDIREAWKGCA